jgi:hypothetical protein
VAQVTPAPADLTVEVAYLRFGTETLLGGRQLRADRLDALADLGAQPARPQAAEPRRAAWRQIPGSHSPWYGLGSHAQAG